MLKFVSMGPVEVAALDLLGALEENPPTSKRPRIEPTTSSTVVFCPEPRPAETPLQPQPGTPRVLEAKARTINPSPAPVPIAPELSIQGARWIIEEAGNPDGQLTSISGLNIRLGKLPSPFGLARTEMEKDVNENVIIQHLIAKSKN